MTDNSIKIKNKNILKLEIETEEGIKTGEFLEFDLNDIDLPLKFQEMVEKDKKNKQNLRNQLLIIDKKEDIKGKKLLSVNEEAKVRALRDFFVKEKAIYNEFLGKNGVEKLLNGQKFGWDSLEMIDDIIINQIAPHLDLTVNDMIKKVKEKYKTKVANNTLELDDINE